MTALFRNNSPSKRTKGNSANMAKFPFILMPVTDIGDDGVRTNERDIVPPPPLENLVPYPRSTANGARRKTSAHDDVRSRFPSISSARGIPECSPQEQIRRAARTLYPIQAGEVRPGNNRISSSNSRESGFDGISLPAQQFQVPAVVLPSVCTRKRSAHRFRAYSNQSESNVSASACVVSASNSTPQLVFAHGEAEDDLTSDLDSHETKNGFCERRELQRQLQEKDKEIHQLKQEQAKLKTTLKETALEAQTIKFQQESLRREFATLENHFDSLEEKFDNQEDISSVREILTQAMRGSPRSRFLSSAMLKSPVALPNHMDFDRLISMIQELNTIAGSYQALEIEYTNVGATFTRPNPITLTLYRNGMTLDNTLFRPYLAVSTIQFIQDIYDGYFPSELQSKYPDGITIVVKDERSTVHPGGFIFPGEGRKIGEQVEFVSKFYPGKKLTAAKKEQVKLKPYCSSPQPSANPTSRITYVHLPDLLPNSNAKSEAQPQRALYKNTRQQSLNLKLRNLQTGTIYKLKTNATVTPDEIVRHLETQLEFLSPSEDGSCRKYQLLNSVPFGLFTIGDTSLRRYGITSNALFYFRSI